jgi:purine-binding chemotaxis protein CheW
MAADPTDKRLDFDRLYKRLDEIDEALTGDATLSPEERQRVLQERARALSRAREDAPTQTVGVLAFRVAAERYGVRLSEVELVLESETVCSLPGAPPHVLGAILARSKIIPVLDLRQMLGAPQAGISDLTRVVVVNSTDGMAGIAAEEVEGRVDLVRSDLSAPTSGPFHFIHRDRLAVLDLSRLSARQKN